jgi:hypothetical protein
MSKGQKNRKRAENKKINGGINTGGTGKQNYLHVFI